VRTHAQKYFLRLERERRKKCDDDGKDKDHDLYNSSGDEMYNSDQSSSPMEELSPPTTIASPPHPALLQSQPQQPAPPTRRRRSTSLISPTMAKVASQYQSAVLAELPLWHAEDYEQFSKGLLSVIDKQDDISLICRFIRDGFLPNRTAEDVEVCYKQLHKIIKQKPAALLTAPVGSPKRRRTSKPELPISIPLISEGPLPAMGSMPPINSSNNFTTFMSSLPNMTGPPLPPPQYVNTSSSNNNINNSSNNSSVTLLPFQPPQLGGLMNMGMNMRPLLDYSNMPSMQSLQINNMGMGMSNMTMMDIGSPNIPSSNSSSSHQWNSLALSFDLHQNAPSLSLPQGAPLVSSLN